MAPTMRYILLCLFHISVLQVCKPLSTGTIDAGQHKEVKNISELHLQLRRKSPKKRKIRKESTVSPGHSETRRPIRKQKQKRGKNSKRNQIRKIESKSYRSKPTSVRISPQSTTKSRLEATVGCCENGGQCVLGSFCICPSEFFGRYCEFEVKMAHCGALHHLGWARDRCNLYFCYNGNLSCLPRGLNSCDNSTVSDLKNSTELEIFPPMSDIAEEFPHLTSSEDDYDVDYYGSADSTNQTSHSDSLTLNQMSYFIFLIGCIMINLPT